MHSYFTGELAYTFDFRSTLWAFPQALVMMRVNPLPRNRDGRDEEFCRFSVGTCSVTGLSNVHGTHEGAQFKFGIRGRFHPSKNSYPAFFCERHRR